MWPSCHFIDETCPIVAEIQLELTVTICVDGNHAKRACPKLIRSGQELAGSYKSKETSLAAKAALYSISGINLASNLQSRFGVSARSVAG